MNGEVCSDQRQAQSALADLYEVTTVMGESDEGVRDYLTALGIIGAGAT